MIRILYVHHNADLYGASRSLLRLVSELDRTRFTPHIVLPSDGPLRERLQALGVEVVLHPGLAAVSRSSIGGLRTLGFLACIPGSVVFLWRLVRRLKIDLVHTNSAVVVSSALAARLAGVPHVWHIRESFAEFRRFWSIHSRYMLAASRRVIAVSSAVAQQFPPSDKVTVVYQGLPLHDSDPVSPAIGAAFRARYRLGREPLVGCVGRIKQGRKGQEFLVRAAAIVKEKGGRARWLIVGAPFTGNEAHLQAVEALIRELSLENDFVLTGDLADVRPAYAAMDLLVMPSALPEPFGGVVMEAMAMGLPVVGTRIGGTPEQMDDGVTGFLVPPADPDALAARILQLLSDAPLRERMGNAGRQRLRETFRLTDTVRRIEALYDDAVLR